MSDITYLTQQSKQQSTLSISQTYESQYIVIKKVSNSEGFIDFVVKCFYSI